MFSSISIGSIPRNGLVGWKDIYICNFRRHCRITLSPAMLGTCLFSYSLTNSVLSNFWTFANLVGKKNGISHYEWEAFVFPLYQLCVCILCLLFYWVFIVLIGFGDLCVVCIYVCVCVFNCAYACVYLVYMWLVLFLW